MITLGLFLPRKSSMMNKIMFVILAGILILSILMSGGCVPCETYLAPIDDIDIWADNSSPTQYFLYVLSGEPTSCSHFDRYEVTPASNTTIIVEIFNRKCGTACAEEYSYVENTIPLGSDFVTGANYTVKVNDVTETFVA